MHKDLNFSYQRPTNTQLGHTNVFLIYCDINVSPDYLGYFMPDRSKFRTIGENWVFVPSIVGIKLGFPIIKTSNRKKLIESLSFHFLNV